MNGDGKDFESGLSDKTGSRDRSKATSNELRILIREAVGDGKPHTTSEIKAYVDGIIGDEGKEYTPGQLAGSYTNLCKSGEIQNYDRGIYIKGPLFEKRAAYYTGRRASLPVVRSETIREEESGYSAQICKNIISQLRQQQEQIRSQMDQLRLSRMSGNDLRFIMEVKSLEDTIEDFCQKYDRDFGLD